MFSPAELLNNLPAIGLVFEPKLDRAILYVFKLILNRAYTELPFGFRYNQII